MRSDKKLCKKSYILDVYKRQPIFFSPSVLRLFYNFNTEYVDRVHIRAAKHRRAVLLPRKMAAVTQNVDVWERNVHRHRAKLPALGVKVEAVTDFVPAEMCIRDRYSTCGIEPQHRLDAAGV